MKKSLVLIMIVIYASASSGMVLNMHYCMGKLAAVKVDYVTVKSCMCGSSKPAGDCCNDEVKVLKLNNLHKAAIAIYNIQAPGMALPVHVSLIDISKLLCQRLQIEEANSPPDISSPPAHLLNCVFLI